VPRQRQTEAALVQVKRDSAAQNEQLRTEIVTLKERINHLDAYAPFSLRGAHVLAVAELGDVAGC
jgi:hypothetical protein